MPTVGVIPWLDIPLPEEDSLEAAPASAPEGEFAALIRLPRASNLDEFAPLGPYGRWVSTPSELSGARAIILPGSKSTAADLEWLRQSGLAGAISRLAREGTPILGICGGLQMLGERILDPHGLESGRSEVLGLGLLNLSTTSVPQKTTRLRAATDLFTGLEVSGYEIHHGQSWENGALSEALFWQQGNVSGTYLHGLLENPAHLEQFMRRADLAAPQTLASLDTRLDLIAARARAALDWSAIARCLP